MSMAYPTQAELDQWSARRYRAMTVTERVAVCLETNSQVRRLLYTYLRTMHPGWDDLAVRREIARRFLADDVTVLYG